MPVIFLWPLVVLVAFNRFKFSTALCFAIIGGYLLLPTSTSFDLPILPAINKDSMPSLAAVVIAFFLAAKHRAVAITKSEVSAQTMLPGWVPRNRVLLALLIMIISSSFLTVYFNGDTLVYGATTIPGLRVYDGFSEILTALVTILPLILARKFLATPEDHKVLLLALCIAGLIYSLPTLYEIRMSPQLNLIVYGFFPHSWIQHLRGDGFRPVVFLHHGLWLGIFLSGAVLATLGYLRAGNPQRKWLFLTIAFWLLGTLFLSKNLGAFLISLMLAPALLFFTVRIQLILAVVIAATVLLYPILRGADLIPVNRVVTFAASIEQDRARSLQFRLNNEDILLEKANQRPVFGWGGWGRSRVYDERGKDISTTDGRWIISIGNGGWIGYLASFGLLTSSIFLLAWHQKKYEITLATSALCLVLAGNLIDLIPNAGLTPITWLIAGALFGRLEVQASSLLSTEDLSPNQRGRVAHYNRRRVTQSPHMEATARSARETMNYTRYSPSGRRPRTSKTER
jgi:hypothetical protein